jgi:hypothetical protein
LTAVNGGERVSYVGAKGWSDEPFEGWAAEVDRWPWIRRADDEWFKSGPCPNCKHKMTVVTEGGMVSGVSVSVDVAYYNQPREQGPVGGEGVTVRPGDAGGTGDWGPVLAWCNRCNHEGHPAPPDPRARGCGQAGQISPPP